MAGRLVAFYFDHNVRRELVFHLRAVGHDVVTAHDLGLERAWHDLHLWTAAQQGRILVTNNRDDFLLLHSAWQRWSSGWQVAAVHSGILILPQTWTTERMAQAVEQLLAPGQLLPNELYAWSPSRGWVVP